MLERHYGTSITTAGALISAGAIAADIGIAMIPGVGAAAAGMKSAGQQAAKKTGKEAVKLAAKSAAKQAAKNMALGSAKNGAQRAAALLPAGDEQLQFEITAVFALAIADIHAMDLDRDQALALVYGLSNERVSQKQIATMATDLSSASPEGIVGIGNRISALPHGLVALGEHARGHSPGRRRAESGSDHGDGSARHRARKFEWKAAGND
ncbi:hypothetical protein ACOM2C_16820 [Pseudarthrobacter sp. So.54]